MDPFAALVVCNDPASLSIVQKVLEESGFKVSAFGEAPAADQAFRTTRFDLAVYDSDVAGAMQLADSRSTHLPKMAFALLRNGAKKDEAEGKRVHFMVQKPFSADLFSRSLRAAFGSILRQKRQAFRHVVKIVPSSCVFVNETGSHALRNPMIVDISQTGMCLQANELLTQGARVQVSFELPDAYQPKLSLNALVMWVRASGRTGLKFVEIKAEQQKILNEWLTNRLTEATEADLIPRMPLYHNQGAAARQVSL